MINNLQDELYALETKQAKGAKIRANIRWDLEGEKCSKSFYNVLERQNMQNQTISELYTDDKKTKYSIFLSPQKIFIRISTPEVTYLAML